MRGIDLLATKSKTNDGIINAQASSWLWRDSSPSPSRAGVCMYGQMQGRWPAGLILPYDAETARPSRRLLETPHAGFFFTYNNNALLARPVGLDRG